MNYKCIHLLSYRSNWTYLGHVYSLLTLFTGHKILILHYIIYNLICTSKYVTIYGYSYVIPYVTKCFFFHKRFFAFKNSLRPIRLYILYCQTL